jgi:hypothetical protein
MTKPPLGHLPLMSNIEIDAVRPVSLSDMPNDARFGALDQVGMTDKCDVNGLADRLHGRVMNHSTLPKGVN